MDEKKQRKLGLRLFGDIPRLREVIKHKCWSDILDVGKKYRKEVLERVKDAEIPSKWAYYWALCVGNEEEMKEKIIEEPYRTWIKELIQRGNEIRKLPRAPRIFFGKNRTSSTIRPRKGDSYALL